MHCYETMINCYTYFSVQNISNNVFIIHSIKEQVRAVPYLIYFNENAYIDFLSEKEGIFLRKKNIKK